MYQFNEGAIAVPEGWRDESVNVFVCPDNSGVNLTITRTPMGAGMQADDVYNDTVNEFPPNLPGYKEIAQLSITLNEQPARQLEYQWKSPEGLMHQVVVLLLKESNLISFTLTSPQHMSKKQVEALLSIIMTFQPR